MNGDKGLDTGPVLAQAEANLIGSVSEEFSSGTGHDVLLVKAVPTSSAGERPDRVRPRGTEPVAANA